MYSFKPTLLSPKSYIVFLKQLDTTCLNLETGLNLATSVDSPKYDIRRLESSSAMSNSIITFDKFPIRHILSDVKKHPTFLKIDH